MGRISFGLEGKRKRRRVSPGCDEHILDERGDCKEERTVSALPDINRSVLKLTHVPRIVVLQREDEEGQLESRKKRGRDGRTMSEART